MPRFSFLTLLHHSGLNLTPHYSNPDEMSRRTSLLLHQLFSDRNDTFQRRQKRPLVPIGKKFVGAGDYTRPNGLGARRQLIEQTTHVRRIPDHGGSSCTISALLVLLTAFRMVSRSRGLINPKLTTSTAPRFPSPANLSAASSASAA